MDEKVKKKTKVFGLKTAMVNKSYDGIQERIKESSLVEIMVAKQGWAWFGERRLNI